ncbi:MAG TPA: PilZ domain-containing protein [Tepidisphaeraceae bacterium]|nr:PilZ domain-containing protein [Tepidisphaeraceae bacterium]
MVRQDRRIFPRKRVSLSLEGRTNDGTVRANSGGRVTLQVNDLSLGGLSASVDQPLVRGSRLAVFFPPQRQCEGTLASGKVLRCDPANGAYRIRVEFDRYPSARGRMPKASPALFRPPATEFAPVLRG